MYPFPPSLTPSLRARMDAQAAFLNGMSTSVLRSFQQMCDLNIQLVQTLVELARVTEQHMQNTSRTARALVGDMARSTAAQTELSIREQGEAVRNAAAPFTRPDREPRAPMDGKGEAHRGQQQGAQQPGQGKRPSGASTH
jgi:hypothetical protein